MLEQKVLNTIKKNDLIKNGNTIVIGVSGGPDSMTLLNILISLREKQNYNLVVAHINHGLRKEANDETKYVEEFCNKNNIKCYIKLMNVEDFAKKERIGIEEAGRRIRYNFFEEIAKKEKAQKIATAHTANDNAETVIMNIIRGTGTSGLKGIDIKRDNRYIRPLLEITRKEIEDYCILKNLNPKEDKSNNENIYTRNKVRNELIPYIEKNFNPNLIKCINRMSELAHIENEYIQRQVEEKYKKLVIQEIVKNKEEGKKEIILDLKEYNKQDLVIKNEIILYTINRLLGTCQNIEKIHISDIVKLCNNNIGNKYLTPNKNIKILVNKGKIFFEKII